MSAANTIHGKMMSADHKRGSDAELAMTAVYLAASNYTNGTIVTVDGGLALVNP